MPALALHFQHEQLARLAGTWEGEADIHPNPWGPSGTARGRWDFRLDRNGYALIHDFAEERPGKFRFEAHGVFSVDPATEEIVWFWFDSYGFPPLVPSRGTWSDGRLELLKKTPRGQGRSTFAVNGSSFDFLIENKLPEMDDFAPVSEGRYRRTG